MESINFINPVPPRKQRALLYWFYVSIACVIFLSITLSVIYIRRRATVHRFTSKLNELKQQAGDIAGLPEQKQALLLKRRNIEERLKEFHSLLPHDTSLTSLLMMLSNIIPADIRLTTIEAIPGKLVVLEGLARQTKAVTELLTSLNSRDVISDIKLIRLMPAEMEMKNQLFAFRLEGVWHDSTYLLEQPF